MHIVGVDDLEILDFPDGLLEPTHELRRAIARKIREFRPKAIVVTTFDLQVQWGLNHVDHRHAGVATVDAIRDADNPWVFTDLKDEGLEAWKADRLLINGAQPTHAVALTAAHVDRGVRSLEAHKVYLDALSDGTEGHDSSIATNGGGTPVSTIPTDHRRRYVVFRYEMPDGGRYAGPDGAHC